MGKRLPQKAVEPEGAGVEGISVAAQSAWKQLNELRPSRQPARDHAQLGTQSRLFPEIAEDA